MSGAFDKWEEGLDNYLFLEDVFISADQNRFAHLFAYFFEILFRVTQLYGFLIFL